MVACAAAAAGVLLMLMLPLARSLGVQREELLSRERAVRYLRILMRYKQPPSMRYNPIADGIRRVALLDETVLR